MNIIVDEKQGKSNNGEYFFDKQLEGHTSVKNAGCLTSGGKRFAASKIFLFPLISS
jgi:hypothetical protein